MAMTRRADMMMIICPCGQLRLWAPFSGVRDVITSCIHSCIEDVAMARRADMTRRADMAMSRRAVMAMTQRADMAMTWRADMAGGGVHHRAGAAQDARGIGCQGRAHRPARLQGREGEAGPAKLNFNLNLNMLRPPQLKSVAG